MFPLFHCGWPHAEDAYETQWTMDSHLNSQVFVREIEYCTVGRCQCDDIGEHRLHVLRPFPACGLDQGEERDQMFVLSRSGFCIDIQDVSAKNPHYPFIPCSHAWEQVDYTLS